MKHLVVIIVLTISFIFSNILSANNLKQKEMGVSLYDKLNVREQPDVKSKKIFQMNKGDLFVILDATEKTYHPETLKSDKSGYKWYKIELQPNNSGWVFGQFIGISVTSAITKDKKIDNYFDPAKFQHYKLDVNNDGKKEVLWFAYNIPKMESKEKFDIYLLVNTSSSKSVFILNSKQSFTIYNTEIIQNIRLIDINGDNKPEIVVDYQIIYEGGEDSQESIKFISYSKKGLNIIFKSILQEGGINTDPFIVCKLKIDKKKKSIISKEVQYSYFGIYVPKKMVIKNYRWIKNKYTVKSDKKLPIILVTKEDGLRVREQPDLNSNILKSLKKGDRVQFVKMNEDYYSEPEKWLYVEAGKNTKGWCSSNYLFYEDPLIRDIILNKIYDKGYSYVQFVD